MRNLVYWCLSLLVFFVACIELPEEPKEEIVDEFRDLTAISLDPQTDTTILIEGLQNRTVVARGTFITQRRDTIAVIGVLGNSLQVNVSYDTAFRNIQGSKLEWSSSNNSVASVANGVVSPLGGGNASISCRLASKNITSNRAQIRVIGLPFLNIDPPLNETVELPNDGVLTGRLEAGDILLIDGDTIPYDELGRFSYVVSADAPQQVALNVKAIDPIYPQAFSLEVKTFNFAFPSPPLLTLDYPDEQLVFSDESLIRGQVQTGALLFIDNQPAVYDGNGRFEQVVQLPVDGLNTIEIRAENSTYREIVTTVSKIYRRATPETIVGNWTGTVEDGSNFTFTVSESSTTPGEYEANGLYNWNVLPPFNVTRTNIPFTVVIDQYGFLVGEFTWSRSGAEADVVYFGLFGTSASAVGTIRYDGSWSGNTVARTSPWTATKN